MSDDRLSINEDEWNYNPNPDGAIPIPVRINVEADESDDQDDDALVREYEARYYGPYMHAEAEPAVGLPPRKSKRKWDSYWDSVKGTKLPPRHRYRTRPAPAHLEDSERLWAAAAHASAILTLIGLLATGPGVVFLLLIPLGIYLMFRRRSEYVAYHALQAFTIQTVGTIGALALLVGGSLVMVALIIVAAIFSIVLIGIPFLILFILIWALLAVVSFLMPVVMVIYSMIAAFAAWNGRNFRYPYVADWVDDQLTNGFLSTKVA